MCVVKYYLGYFHRQLNNILTISSEEILICFLEHIFTKKVPLIEAPH
jgi:hypothetical protein